MSLICKINEEDMVDISVNVDKFTDVLRLLNQHQKEQDQKLLKIELKIDEMIKEAQSSTFKDEITSRVELLEAKVKTLEDTIQQVKNSCDEKIGNSINELIVQQKVTHRNMCDQFDSNIYHLTESIQEIKKSTDEIFPKEIIELNARLKYLYSKVLNSQSENANTNTDIDNSTTKANDSSDLLKKNSIGESSEKSENQNIIFQSPNTLFPEEENHSNEENPKSKFIELQTMTNYNKAALMQVASNLEKLSQKVDNLYNSNPTQRTLDIPSRNKRNNTFDPTFDTQKNLSILNDRICQQQDEINELKKYIIKSESLERPIFYALIDALNLIHSHADGMEDIPVQNFETVSPEYFESDPDFKSKINRYCSRFPPKQAKPDKGMPYIEDVDESENSDENKDEKIESEKGSEEVKPIKIIDDKNLKEEDELPSPPSKPIKTVKQISGLLHLVSSHTVRQEPSHSPIKNNTLLQAQIHSQIQAQVQAQLQALAEATIEEHEKRESNREVTNEDNENSKKLNGITIEQNKTIINNFKNNKIEILGTTGRPKPILSRTVNFVVVDMQIGDSLSPMSESEIDNRMRELCFMLGQFKREKDDLMSSIDRKVDRDFVERLFNKFRVLLNDMNDKVIQIQSGSDKYATLNQIEEVFKMIENVKSNIQANASANSTNNHFHKDEAAAGKRSFQECLFCGRKINLVAGGITARSLGSYEESSQFVYGEGGVFKKSHTIGTKQGETKKINLPPLNGGSS